MTALTGYGQQMVCHPHVCLGTVSQAVVKGSEWAPPRVHLNGSPENLGLEIVLDILLIGNES